MQVFQDLIVNGSTARLQEFLEALPENAAPPWTRDEESEFSLQRAALPQHTVRCFLRASSATIPSVRLWIGYRSKTQLRVFNITNLDRRDLSIAEYNAALVDFVDKLASPLLNELGLDHELTPARFDLTAAVSPETAQALRTFSSMANRLSGSAHPQDEKRWYEFVIAAHRNNDHVDSNYLRRWLVEDQGWSEGAAYELVTEYEQGRGLLKTNDELTAATG